MSIRICTSHIQGVGFLPLLGITRFCLSPYLLLSRPLSRLYLLSLLSPLSHLLAPFSLLSPLSYSSRLSPLSSFLSLAFSILSTLSKLLWVLFSIHSTLRIRNEFARSLESLSRLLSHLAQL